MAKTFEQISVEIEAVAASGDKDSAVALTSILEWVRDLDAKVDSLPEPAQTVEKKKFSEKSGEHSKVKGQSKASK